ncbi:Syntaxin 6 protein [Rutstroemia sp. NJR-2017a BBW]|nr:Syntaxin 6 protein [Rutstroemia sp. NJR-2017a BBW]
MMSSTNEDDPFLQVQADVLHQLSLTRPLFTSYLRIHSLTKSPHPTPELLSARSDLTSSLSLLTDDLSDLRDSIAAIQSDPYKYGLQVEEVARRVRLIEEIGGEVDDMREELEKTMKNSRGGSTNANSYDSVAGGGEAEDSDYAAEFEHQQQLQIMKEQDEQLESVFHTVGNLRQQADDMGRELEEQTGMLAEVETVTDRVSGRLQGGMKRMNKLVRDNEDPLSSCCIGVLIFILILLLILVLVL